MTLKIIFAAISIIAGLYGFYPYLKTTITKETKPHSFTWLIWAITQGTAIVALWLGGGGIGALSLTIGTILVFVVFLLSLTNKKPDITKSDIVILSIALGAIFIWWFLDNPFLALIIVVSIDVLGYIPTFRKSYHHPDTENVFTWGIFMVSNIFAILALESYNFMTLAYLVSIALTEIALLIFLLVRRKIIL